MCVCVCVCVCVCSGAQHRRRGSVRGHHHRRHHVFGHFRHRGAVRVPEEPPRLRLGHHGLIGAQRRIPAGQHQDGAHRYETDRTPLITVTLYYKTQFSLLTICLLACILLAYWLFIKHILMCYSSWLYFRSHNPPHS